MLRLGSLTLYSGFSSHLRFLWDGELLDQFDLQLLEQSQMTNTSAQVLTASYQWAYGIEK